ncbi:class I SAM-dependent methyltransferase [Patescibacteria group bacterium]|nr:class I SAM-dependent methyltransferase [Patescibacteria group bacterium]MBU1074582.1 class I SAM-dependent methyltransferase [Patescibacteria group bacterium]MBU1952370.1 class I SAM-dependent methyltransferase [Patescibacteria group bacterium]
MNKNTADSILEKVASDYNNIAGHFSQTRYRDWAEFSDFEKFLKTGVSVLDVGCGNGRLLHFLNRYRVKYVGIDVSSKLLKIAKQLVDEKICTSITSHSFIEASAEKLPFADRTFDIAFAIASLYHIPSKELRQRSINEISRVLKPGGVFIMTYWNMWERSRRTLIYNNITDKLVGKSNLDFFDANKPWKNPKGQVLAERFCHAFTLREIERLSKKSSFRTVDKYYMKKGQKSNSKYGFNGVYIGKKY